MCLQLMVRFEHVRILIYSHFLEACVVGVSQKVSKRKLFGQPGDQALGNVILDLAVVNQYSYQS